MKKFLAVPVAAFALTLSLSACGSESDGADSSPSLSASESMEEFAKERGLDIKQNPDGSGSISGGDGGGGGGGSLTAAQRESLTKLRECMIKKGYDMPEVDPNNPVMAPKNANGKSAEQVNKDAAECAGQPSGG